MIEKPQLWQMSHESCDCRQSVTRRQNVKRHALYKSETINVSRSAIKTPTLVVHQICVIDLTASKHGGGAISEDADKWDRIKRNASKPDTLFINFRNMVEKHPTEI